MTTAAGLVEGGPFTAKQRKSIESTLKEAGFVKAVEEATKGTGSNEGFSLVMEFSNPAGAQTGAALFLHLAQSGQKGTKPFSVTGVTGRQGCHGDGRCRRVGQRVLVGRGLRVRLGPLRRHGHLGQGRRRTPRDRHPVPGETHRHHLPVAAGRALGTPAGLLVQWGQPGAIIP